MLGWSHVHCVHRGASGGAGRQHMSGQLAEVTTGLRGHANAVYGVHADCHLSVVRGWRWEWGASRRCPVVVAASPPVPGDAVGRQSRREGAAGGEKSRLGPGSSEPASSLGATESLGVEW